MTAHFFDEKEFGGLRAKVIPSMESELSVRLLHNSILMGNPDGEDSQGRAKLAIMAPAATARRACDIAAAMMDEWERRGWIKPDPSLVKEGD